MCLIMVANIDLFAIRSGVEEEVPPTQPPKDTIPMTP